MEDLLSDMERGRIRIPHFQRPLKWQRSDAWELLDSILRGYPVGTLLLWKGGQNVGERSGSPRERSPAADDPTLRAADSDTLWVVDGQQRLDALRRLLLNENDTFQAWVDLDSPDPVPTRPLKEELANDDARWVPVRELRNAEAQLEWAFSVNLSGERRARAFQLGRRLREYEVPAYVIEADNEDILRQVFKRINSTGKQMQESEVFDALHGNIDVAGAYSLESMSDDLRSLQFGEIPPQLLLQLVAVLTGHDIGSLDSLTIERGDLAETFARTRGASVHAVQFLVQDARIPHIRLLPYSHLFVVVARFVDRFPDAPPIVRRQLAMAIWRGLVTDNASPRIGTIRTLIRLLATPDASAAQVSELLVTQLSEGGRRELAPMEGFLFRAARSKIRALALWSLGPRDARSGQLLSAAEVLDNDGALATLAPGLTQLAARTISGNRLFHPDRAHMARDLAAASAEIRASHLLPQEALPDSDDTYAWIDIIWAREEAIARLEKSFTDRLAAWNERPRPPINELWVDDGDEP